MKSLPFLFIGTLLLLFACSCPEASVLSSSSDQSHGVAVADTTPMPTVILWVDKKLLNYGNGTQVRTAKARVTINSEGKLSLHSFVKEQPLHVRRYLKHRLITFKVTKAMMDGDHVKQGEQYVQLRYFPELADKFR